MHKDNPNPLLLVSTGRSGTTLLMGYLAAHPEIIANTTYPLENRSGQYFAHVGNILLGQTTGNTDQYFGTILEGKPWATANPYRDSLGTTWIKNEFQPKLASLLKDTIRHIYLEEAEKQGKTPRFFAEKTLMVSKARHALKSMFPAYREILLIRDPRAVIASMLNFNKKRGSADFGTDKFKSATEHIEAYATGLTKFRQHVEKSAPQNALVRYEDLVTSPDETLARVFGLLGIAADETTLQGIIKTSRERSDSYIKAHSTTASAVDSITSWGKNLPEEYRDAIEDQMADLLKYFRYTDK